MFFFLFLRTKTIFQNSVPKHNFFFKKHQKLFLKIVLKNCFPEQFLKTATKQARIFRFFCFQEQKTILENNCQTRLKSFFTSWISSILDLLSLFINLLSVALIHTEGKLPGPDPSKHPSIICNTHGHSSLAPSLYAVLLRNSNTQHISNRLL